MATDETGVEVGETDGERVDATCRKADGAVGLTDIGLLFGALASSPRAAVQGLGIPLRSLAFGMPVFPAAWD